MRNMLNRIMGLLSGKRLVVFILFAAAVFTVGLMIWAGSGARPLLYLDREVEIAEFTFERSGRLREDNATESSFQFSRLDVIEGTGLQSLVVSLVEEDITPELYLNKILDAEVGANAFGEISQIGQLSDPGKGVEGAFTEFTIPRSVQGDTGEYSYIEISYLTAIESESGVILIRLTAPIGEGISTYPYYEQIVNSIRLTEQPASTE